MKSLEELKTIKDSAQQNLVLREKTASVKITVGMGDCGFEAGARTILTTFLEEVANRKLPSVMVCQSDCLGECKYEPTVKVEINGEVTMYGNVTVGVAKAIVESHIVNGSVVKELTIEHLKK